MFHANLSVSSPKKHKNGSIMALIVRLIAQSCFQRNSEPRLANIKV